MTYAKTTTGALATKLGIIFTALLPAACGGKAVNLGPDNKGDGGNAASANDVDAQAPPVGTPVGEDGGAGAPGTGAGAAGGGSGGSSASSGSANSGTTVTSILPCGGSVCDPTSELCCIVPTDPQVCAVTEACAPSCPPVPCAQEQDAGAGAGTTKCGSEVCTSGQQCCVVADHLVDEPDDCVPAFKCFDQACPPAACPE